MKAAEDRAAAASAEVTSLRSRLSLTESSLHRSQEERQQLEALLSKAQGDLSEARDRAAEVAVLSQSKLRADRLQSEADAAQERIRELSQDCHRLQYTESLLQDLVRELNLCRDTEEGLSASVSSPLGKGKAAAVSATASSSKSGKNSNHSSSTGGGGGYSSVLHAHVAWTSIPSLRQLCVPLYENIRRLFQDLSSKEADCRGLSSDLSRCRAELKALDEEYARERERFRVIEQRLHDDIDADRARLSDVQQELIRGRSSTLVMEQIKEVVRGFADMQRGSATAAEVSFLSTREDRRTGGSPSRLPGAAAAVYDEHDEQDDEDDGSDAGHPSMYEYNEAAAAADTSQGMQRETRRERRPERSMRERREHSYAASPWPQVRPAVTVHIALH